MAKLRRRYYYENIFSSSQGNLEILRALKRKYTRDYKTFFERLSEQYVRGEAKDLSDKGLQATTDILEIITAVIESNKISGGNADRLTQLTSELETIKDQMVKRSQDVVSFGAKLKQIEKQTGISPEALNVSKQITTQGIEQVRRQTEPDILSRFEEGAPRTTEAIKEFGKSAFYAAGGPLAGVVLPFISDLATVTKRGFQKRSDIRERQARSEIYPRYAERPQKLTGRQFPKGFDLGKILSDAMAAVPSGGPSPAFAGITPGRADLVKPLKMFFNREAYDARWTADLLKSVKQIGERIKGDGTNLLETLGLVGLASKFKSLGAAVLPLIGKFGLFAGLGTATFFAIKNTIGVVDEVKKLIPALSDLAEAAKRDLKLEKKFEEVVPENIQKATGKLQEVGIGGVAREKGLSYLEVARSLAIKERAQKIQKLPLWKRALGIGTPSVGDFDKRTAEIIREFGRTSEDATQSQARFTSPPELPEDTGDGKEILNTLKSIDSHLRRQSEGVTGIGAAQIRDPYDSGDELIRSFNGGNLMVNE